MKRPATRTMGDLSTKEGAAHWGLLLITRKPVEDAMYYHMRKNGGYQRIDWKALNPDSVLSLKEISGPVDLTHTMLHTACTNIAKTWDFGLATNNCQNFVCQVLEELKIVHNCRAFNSSVGCACMFVVAVSQAGLESLGDRLSS